MANYTLGIVAHVARQEQIEKLRLDVNPDLVEVDDGTYGVMGNHVLTMDKLYHNGRRCGQEWLVILEDDAQPVVGFHQQVNGALDVAPTRLVSFYSGSGHPAARQAVFEQYSQRQDVHWIMHHMMRHAIAYAVHVDMIELGLLDMMINLERQRWAPDDAIGKFARRHSELISYTNPSLVDHEDGQPMVKGRTSLGIPMLSRRRPRKAHWVGTRMVWHGIDNAGQV